MKAVVQRERTGCGIASAAAIAGWSYARARAVAKSMGIEAADPRLWSTTTPVRTLLRRAGFAAGPETPFRSWKSLPDLALLSIKWHLERGRPFWHWVVFVREAGEARVLDPKRALKTNVRADFGRMKPKWFIPVRRA